MPKMVSQVSSEIDKKYGGLPLEIWTMVADIIPETSKRTLYIVTKFVEPSVVYFPHVYTEGLLWLLMAKSKTRLL
ncbi:uncharacterized protein EAF02_010557 [Botrytis sinoallii]|uniref:uncharacterized protein n=1 Tax=Botrytis sinoallii TaxID=1463999 RepID=UPI00190149EE|nr:uncharacterized protein EAF02_010557 [Botrytis sinoallii]KAF7861603.1 hypothetical protein EAF02_010557 [Botrytis sinoallii]